MIRRSHGFYCRVFFLLILLTIPAVFSMHPHACANDQDSLIFILDASGSTLGKIEGRAKIDIAKDVMTDLVKELPDGLNVGLVAYGHRKKGDCRDVEQIVPLGPLDKDRMIAGIKGLNPKGKAPITLSILRVFEALKTYKEECTIVLISNGKETCTGDPCKLVRRLKKIGIQFVMHVIGFDVSTEDKVQLECIAAAGGGMYYPVKDAGEFRMAARNVTKVAPKPKGPALCVGATKNGERLTVHITIRKGDRIVANSDNSIRNPEKFYLDPGLYRINATDTSMDRSKTQTAMVEFKDVEMIQIFDFSEGSLNIKVVKNGFPSVGYIYVRRAGTEETIATGDTSDSNPATIKLHPGTYDVVVTDPELPGEPSVSFSGIKIKGGKILEKAVCFNEKSIK